MEWSFAETAPVVVAASAGRNGYRICVARGRVIGNTHENPELLEMKNN
ncbi:YopX family protein [uncultured Desulfobulbus sp.]